MKLLYLFLPLFVILSVNGQRRTPAKTETTEVEQHQPLRGRGRSRFTATQEFAQLNEPTKAPQATTASRRVTSRKRVTETTERRTTTRTTEKPQKHAYEVEEFVNEPPIESLRRQNKPRVLTESRYEALNAPKRKLIDPSQAITEVPEKLLKTFDNTVSDTTVPETSSVAAETTYDADILSEFTDTTFKTNALDISSEGPKSNEITRDFTRSDVITTPKSVDSRRSQNGVRRNNVRTRTTSAEILEEHATQASRSRTRTRPTKKPEEVIASATNSRVFQKTPRRRSEVPTSIVDTKKSPLVLTAEETQVVTRSRAGRRINNSVPEKITVDLAASKSRDISRKRTAAPETTATITTQRSIEDKKRTNSVFPSRNSEFSASTTPKSRSRSRDVIPTLDEFAIPTAPSRNKFRSRDLPPIIDEQKLEVLPLFAAEPKIVRPVSKSRSRSRTRSVKSTDEKFQTSATENDLKFVKPNEITAKVSVSRSQTVNVETRTQTSVKEKPAPQKAQVKESVIAEVTEVTSKRTVSRRKHNERVKEGTVSAKSKANKPKVSVSQVVTSSRGRKKSEVNLADVKKKKDNSEEIEESDNYPEPFKALIQAKKTNKESRPSSRPHGAVPTITTVVTSSTAPSTVVSSTKEDDYLENELDPKPSRASETLTRPTRKRLSLTTKSPQNSSTTATRRHTPTSRKSSKVIRSTSSPSSSSKEHRFHAKFTTKSSTRSESSSSGKSERTTAHPRGLYSSRKHKDTSSNRDKSGKKNNAEAAIRSTQVPKSASLKKSSRYSSKYRSDISSRGSAARSTTSSPAYIPTIPTAAYIPTVPTVTPPRTTVYSGSGTKDVDLGLEVISFDDPVNTVPSANLINGEYTSSTENALNIPVTVVKDGTTEKPVSIIERIINSITAISTTSSPDSLKQTSTASTTESSSAILKLATKKPTKFDKTKTPLDETQTYPTGTVAFTTENPTTIIERILSSLSAIQATDDTNSNQVGKDFNTISSPSTTPVSRVIKSSTSRTTLPAQISTSINPLKVLDEIADEQVLQKRTIGKLLALLNGLISTTESPQRLVVVTPKPSSFVTGSNDVTPNSLTITDTSPPSSTTPDSFATSISQTTVASVTASSAVSTTPATTESFTPSDAATSQLFTSAIETSLSPGETGTMTSLPVALESRIGDSVDVQTPATTSTLPTTQSTQIPITSDTIQTEAIIQSVTSNEIAASTVPIQTEATIQTTVPSEPLQNIPSSTVTQSGTQVFGNTQTDVTESVSSVNAVPLSADSNIPSSLMDSTTSNTFPTTTEVGLTGTTDTDPLFSYLSTTPTLQNFEVSPGSVSIFSANDISNSVTPDDNIFTTVTIVGRSNFETTATTESTTTETGTTDNIPTTSPSVSDSAEGNNNIQSNNSQMLETVESVSVSSGSIAQRISVEMESNTIETLTTQDDITKPSDTMGATTTQDITTPTDSTQDTITESTTTLASIIQATMDDQTQVNMLSIDIQSGDVESSTVQSGSNESSSVENNMSSSPVTDNVLSTTTAMTDTSNQTSANTSNNISLSNRSGRLLNIVQEPIQNSLDVSTPSTTTSTTPDYFIFAVLNNNTILRKKPPTIPNKEIPYVIVGFYPNNTVVRKFPNGTLVPMEQIIRVRGFDTRENPPPLPEITSNQVTNDPGSSADNKNVQTVDQNTIPSIEANPLSLNSVSSESSAPETSISTNSESTVSNTSSTTQSTTITTAGSSSSTAQTAVITDNNTIAESSISPSVDSTTAPSTVPSTTVVQITNAATTTPVNNVPVSTLATATVSSTTLGSSTQTPSSTLPTLSELLNGRTLEAFSNIINNTNTNTNTNTNYQTLQVNKSVTSTELPLVVTTVTTTQASLPIETTSSSTTMLTTETVAPPMQTTTMVFTVTPVETTTQVETTPIAPVPVPLSNRILENTTPQATVTPAISTTPLTTTTEATTTTTTTTEITTTTVSTRTFPSTTPRLTNTPTKTVLSISTTFSPVATSVPEKIPTATFFPTFPTFLTTLFPNLLRATPEPRSTKAPPTTTTQSETIAFSASTPQPTTIFASRSGRIDFMDVGDPTTVVTTARPTTTATPITTTTPAPTTTTITTTTTLPPPVRTTSVPQTTAAFVSSTKRSVPFAASTSVVPVVSAAPISSTTPKLKQLTEEQKKNLETLAELEREQAALLKQLSFLTSLNFGGNRNGGKKEATDLANRVVALAVERDKTKTTTVKPPESIQDQLSLLGVAQTTKKTSSPSIEDVLKQYNLTGFDIETTPTTAAYGKSNDAILAAILKEQGIAPPTPKSLAEQINKAGVFTDTTTKKPRPTTTTQRPPGRLMQGLNWLLNVLSPQTTTTTRRPRKPVKPKKPPVDQELLANSPTRLTPVVTEAPKPNTLSQDDIKKLIKQLEAAQKDPNNADAIDFSQIKSLQNLLNTDEGVQVLTNSQNGATSRVSSTVPSTTQQKVDKRPTTVASISVSNAVEDEEFEVTTAKSRPSLPRIRLRPVPGVDDNNSDPLIRSNLITAAVNVTRAISGFLGSALQGAAQSFQSLLGSGSTLSANYAQGSSARPG